MNSTPLSPLTPATELKFALLVGVMVLPLFAPQPLVGLIAASAGFAAPAAGFVAASTLLGYTCGLCFLVPLIDLIEARRAVLASVSAGVVGSTAATLAPSAAYLLIAALGVGVATSAIQMVISIVAGLVSEARRGQVVGKLMSGLMVGVLLSRPIASLAGERFGWRGSYGLDAMALLAVLAVLNRSLPVRRPQTPARYREVVGSLWKLLLEEETLRRRTLYQALCMAAFGLFWTAVPVRLMNAPFSLGQIGVALFAFCGVAGAIVSPLAGWAGDHHLSTPATRLAHAAVVTGAILAGIAGAGWLGFDPAARPTLALTGLAAAALIVDTGVIADQTLGRRAVNLLRPEARGRVNGLYTGLFFVGGSIGSAIAGLVWTQAGWTLVCALCAGFGVAALALSATSTTQREAGAADKLPPAPPATQVEHS